MEGENGLLGPHTNQPAELSKTNVQELADNTEKRDVIYKASVKRQKNSSDYQVIFCNFSKSYIRK